MYIQTYLQIDLFMFGLMGRVFANRLGDWGSILGRVIPKTQKNGTWCHLAKHSALYVSYRNYTLSDSF